MIVSHQHRFIYFAVPRTATHSVRSALAPHLGPDDWQQQSLNEKQSLPIPELARAGHGHIGVRALKPHLPDEQWNDYYKFALVRDPYDRFVSVCAFLNRDNKDFASNPVEWMLAALNRPRFQQRLLVRPQVDMLVDDTGELAPNFIGRFEQLSAAVHNVALRVGLPALELPHRNCSPRTTGANELTGELLASLNEFYAEDFDKLQYATRSG